MKIISYLEFKLNKEMAYENTFGKEEKIQKEYEEYVKEEKEKIKRILSSRRSNNLPI
tara:strand:+ start:2932 stop:3102 length:171 start_codon:yes stop_codon:yes gene_type:complete